MLSLLWPRPARLMLGGRPASVVPLRLADLAGLETWAAGRTGDVATSLHAALSVPDAPARHDELRRLYELHERGGVSFGHPDVGAWLATQEGRAEQVRLSLRVRDRRTGRIKRPSLAVCRDMARDATDEEWWAWAAIAWQAHPLDELAKAIDREIGAEWPTARPRSGAGETPGDGWMLAAWVVIEATGWTFDQLGRLTLAQWDVARMRGKPRESCYAVPGQVPDGTDPREFDAFMAKRAAFWDAKSTAGGNDKVEG